MISSSTHAVAAMQPYFLPYIGYWQLMHAVDTFILLDDVNYINGGWINRNRILVQGEPHLFTLPVAGASQNRRIDELVLADAPQWPGKFRRTLKSAYAKAPFFEPVMAELIEPILACKEKNLAAFLAHSLRLVASRLGIASRIVSAGEIAGRHELKGEARIIDLCRRSGATRYINLPGGQALYDAASFRHHGIELRFLEPDIRVYPQQSNPFVPSLSIIDIVMNCSLADCRAMLGAPSNPPSISHWTTQ